MTYVREVTKLTIITLAYIDYFLSVIRIGLHSVVDVLVDFELMFSGFESRESHDFFFFFFLIFHLLFFLCFLLSLL